MSITKSIKTRRTHRGTYILIVTVYQEDKWILNDLREILDLFFEHEEKYQHEQEQERKRRMIPPPTTEMFKEREGNHDR